ncbi:MAG: hypothetical protein AUG49_16640 [Catenulispora sp. 13_1_20CM_3_70_7]|nr:MAG: hypothetical protein AUG49_16640 [Catenulispora sp. 13_1_20CM_3_70_7]
MPRSAESVRVRASSAVDASCRPRALHSVTPSGTNGRTCSYPAVSVCATFNRGIRAISCGWASANAYGTTRNSTSPMESGISAPVNTSATRPSGTSFAERSYGTHTRRGAVGGVRLDMRRMLSSGPGN